ncbi:hypothetical protein L9F63_014616 [Diploptera punctata]|uniref:Atos-like conserved domain-containing protein n=1 Tax=Diploptera punctata TaxID=6984 RepID=A0AAD8A7K1_DIPPU|nr:hypothetical protein L9F63_014616 [Diploptera punctata]
MHSVMEGEEGAEPHDVFVDLGILIVEGRIPGGAWAAGRGYGEGPHCAGVGISTLPARHDCDPASNFLCERAEKLRKHMQLLWQNNIPMCIEVLLCADCQCGQQKAQSPEIANIPSSTDLLLEQWVVTMVTRRCADLPHISVRSLFQAVRSQLHFSQLSAWWSCSKGASPAHVNYRVTVPGEAFASHFQRAPVVHSFPVASVSRGTAVKVCVRSLPRMNAVPRIRCPLHNPTTAETEQGAVGGAEEPVRWGEVCAKHSADPLLGESLLDPPQSLDLFTRRYQSPSRCGSPSLEAPEHLMFGRGTVSPPVKPDGLGRPAMGRLRDSSPPSPPHHRRLGRQGLARRRDGNVLPGLVDDRMQTPCNRPGKHHCRCAFDEDLESAQPQQQEQPAEGKRLNLELSRREFEEVLSVLRDRSGSGCSKKLDCSNNSCYVYNVPSCLPSTSRSSDKASDLLMDAILKCNDKCDRCDKLIDERTVWTNSRKNVNVPSCGDTPAFINKGLERIKDFFKGDNKCTISHEAGEGSRPIPSALDKAKFRQSLDSAASMVFHCRTGLPLTSSPAPVRRGTSCFDFDSSLNSVSAIRSALFESVPTSAADDALSISSDDAESSPGIGGPALSPLIPSFLSIAPCASLLGSFEESVLNGRLEPVSTVQGFTAELGASGSFCPRHLVLPVTVFFYTLGDNDKVSTPYLGHINLGKKGYTVPRSGTIQVTLFNPLGTVVKMFVVMYDLADMPANSQTFLRQRTLYMPANTTGTQPDNAQKWLRYLIHLRFSSSKSGRIYLHSDIRMIIFRKSDMDTATAHGMDMAYELRSFTHGPTNPKFSPRK